MNNFSVIVFDLGNVLIPFDYNIIINKLENIEEGLGVRFYKFYQNNYYVHKDFEKWSISTEKFIEIMLKWADNKIDAETFCKIYSEVFTVNTQVTDLLPLLKKNYKLVLLSNTNYIHQKYGWQQYHFLKNFDKLILSHEVHAVKPEPEIYQAVMNFTNEAAEKHLFIDDVEEYVEGAKAMGWDAVQYVSYEKLIRDFTSRNIKY